jgi:hypothetical protein
MLHLAFQAVLRRCLFDVRGYEGQHKGGKASSCCGAAQHQVTVFVPFDVEEAPSKYRLECQLKHLKRVCATLQQCFPGLPTATVQEVPTATGGAAYLFVLTVKDYEHAIGEALFDTARHLALLVGNLQGAWYNMPAMTSTHLASSNSFPADRFGSGDSDYAPALLLEEYADWGYYLYSA